MWWFGLADTDQDRGQRPEQDSQVGRGRTDGAGSVSAPDGAADDDLQQQEESDAEINDLVMRLLPWGVSFLTHLGLILLAVFIVWSAIDSSDKDKQPIIPIAKLSKTPGAPVKTRMTQSIARSSPSRRSVLSTNESTAPSRSKTPSESTLIGVHGGAGGGSNPFSTDIGTGTGIGAQFFGTGGNAYRIVYLIDATGSLIDSLDYVIIELKRSINDLSSKQEFTVIFFQGDQIKEVTPKGMKKATPRNKARVIEWIDPSSGNVTPMLPGNPVPALRLALKYRPELVFILSDNITGSGRYEIDQRHLLKEVEKANKNRTAINTIQFLYPDKLEEYGLKPTLEMIAARNGGTYNFVDARELGIE